MGKGHVFTCLKYFCISKIDLIIINKNKKRIDIQSKHRNLCVLSITDILYYYFVDNVISIDDTLEFLPSSFVMLSVPILISFTLAS